MMTFLLPISCIFFLLQLSNGQNLPISTSYDSSTSLCEIETGAAQSAFWLGQITHEGTSPFLLNGEDYQVFRNVKEYGAVGDGTTDDTNAFNRAITEQSRMGGGKGSGGTTGQPALIYVPPGTYVVSSKVQLFVGTQLIGDAVNRPTIKASPKTRNSTKIIDGYDFGTQSTTNFYIGVRNIIIDTTAATSNDTIFALNWAVSQATSLINVDFVMPKGSNHIGIEMNGETSGGGSGLFMGDLNFVGGRFGIFFSNQQYSIRGCRFTDVGTAIKIDHAFVVTLQQIECVNVEICVDMGGSGVTGSLSLIDSSCVSCGTVVSGSSSIVLENIAVRDSGPTLKVDGVPRNLGDLTGKTYVAGHIFRSPNGGLNSTTANSTMTNSTTVNPPNTNSSTPASASGTLLRYTKRGNLVDSSGRYFSKQLPQYEQYPVSAFASVKSAGAKGDGVTDDTAAIQQALLRNANCKITYFPHGIYLVTDTIYVPPGSRIVGEVWSTISASGAMFKDENAPRPMIQVGKPGEVGLAEFTDMQFSAADVLPGAILVEVNMAGKNQGDVSFHNTHYRVGGAADSLLETACQTISEPCKAVFLVLHLTKSSSTYIENAWLWSADHDLDNVYVQQIGTGRGMLVEATKGTWLVGTGSEHHTLYAYQFVDASNVFAALMQVETPYWQPLPRAPLPWTPDAAWNDPDFAGCQASNISQCNMQWALRIIGKNTHTLPFYGQGFWLFFNGPNYGSCTGPGGTCQINIVDLEDVGRNAGVELYNLNTKGVQNLITVGGSNGVVVTTEKASPGSWGGLVAAFLGYQ
ncbi:unnamed protein product [Zymoseptoria tritici ST99CH_1A5]|uniref:Rhamnogalacturonase A/B/Epimerase-like pectate lyase domain-containing protein n=1 Tax=Zymoseptoria tritici ST99CH_1A5 TaxID=1276529 RepID=A0A1Y6L6G5_ZYMTR|nr:unnamed protein product [Zymoseptoria tritici ST99CH_1A5]